MKNLLFKNFIEDSGIKISTAIELGGGNGDDATFLCGRGASRIILIDKKKVTGTLDKCVKIIQGDYFDTKIIESENIDNNSYDLVFSSCSLCFNGRLRIEERLPFYINKIKKGGMFYVLDFTSDEKTVTDRTNLWDIWFFSLLNKHFDTMEIKTQHVYEEAHGHFHDIFQLVCFDKK